MSQELSALIYLGAAALFIYGLILYIWLCRTVGY